jgi:hypothetical protein
MLDRLENPPIVEVACGVIFEEIAALDPIFLGTYWLTRKDAFSGRQLGDPAAAKF